MRARRLRRPNQLGVAACNHRAFCSQSSVIPAQIICEQRTRNAHALCECAHITCDVLAIIGSCSHYLRMRDSSGQTAVVAYCGAELRCAFRVEYVVEIPLDFRRVRLESLRQGWAGSRFAPASRRGCRNRPIVRRDAGVADEHRKCLEKDRACERNDLLT